MEKLINHCVQKCFSYLFFCKKLFLMIAIFVLINASFPDIGMANDTAIISESDCAAYLNRRGDSEKLVIVMRPRYKHMLADFYYEKGWFSKGNKAKYVACLLEMGNKVYVIKRSWDYTKVSSVSADCVGYVYSDCLTPTGE